MRREQEGGRRTHESQRLCFIGTRTEDFGILGKDTFHSHVPLSPQHKKEKTCCCSGSQSVTDTLTVCMAIEVNMDRSDTETVHAELLLPLSPRVQVNQEHFYCLKYDQ